ncbi:DUF1045 domain-containing protein [Shimia biformata]|uniref:DUF1045 domain-containing protein n=1 Tax=Shimia biformata TaxID=1294299 RepID=UPI00194FDDBF|nr:DUF1045 domain-containing protein [Shimia biformata]
MENFVRYAVYAAPAPGPLSQFAAAWLGWDAVGATDLAHPDIPGLPAPVTELTARPRKYGFHGTLKPPFRLATGQSADALQQAVATLAASLSPVVLDGLELRRLGGFLALVPEGDTSALSTLAARCVAELDPFRAPASNGELDRRRGKGLTPPQEANLIRWGYPYVMDEFRFHLTLTGSLPRGQADSVKTALTPILAPLIPRPFVVDALCLFAERADGRFVELHRYTLSG